MKEFFDSFSNREISLFSWLFIFIISLFFSKTVRSSFSGIFDVFMSKYIIIPVLAFFIYVYLTVFLLKLINFWDISLLKDTILWTFGFAIVLIFQIGKAERISYFKAIFFDCIKWTVIIEFIIGFYTFGLLTEFILIPILTIIVFIQSVAELKPEHKIVSTFFNKILSIFGIILFCYVAYKTFTQSGILLTFDNLKSFLLPIFLTILFLPFIYFLSLYSQYERFFIRINYLISKEKLKNAKKQTLFICNINLDKITNLLDNAMDFEDVNIKDYLFQMSKKRKMTT